MCYLKGMFVRASDYKYANDLQQPYVFHSIMAIDPTRKRQLWLNPKILQWMTFSQGGAEPTPTVRSRAYEMWKHAEQGLSLSASELQRVDVITTLKRSVDHRIRALDETYSFRSIPIKDKPSELLSLLELFEIVRPLMFRNLLAIRNAVEHEDGQPPDYAASQMFLELTWYFLRSTDRMLQLVSDQIGFYPSDDSDCYWLELTYGPKNWNPTLRGWVRAEIVSTQPQADWILIISEKIETYGELIEQLKREGDTMLLNHHSRQEKNPDDIYFHGDVRGPHNIIVSLTKIYFSAV